jgi:hypothetical protein
LSRWLRKNAASESKLTGLFCLSVWLGPYIPHDADIGAYSKTVPAKVYKLTAQLMPKLVCVAAYCNAEKRKGLLRFLEIMEAAETDLTKTDEAMVDLVTEKDRGPFLYWLLNECCSPLQRLLRHAPHARPALFPVSEWNLSFLAPLGRSHPIPNSMS